MCRMSAKGRGGARPAARPDDKRGGRRLGAGSKPDLVGRVQEAARLASEHRHKFSAAELQEYRAALADALTTAKDLTSPDEEWGGEVL